MKIGLGTVQFGLDYGVSNTEGKTAEGEVHNILDIASQNGLRIIDTAALYGTSEEVLGKYLPSKHDFNIVTKTPRFSSKDIAKKKVELLEASFYHSLEKMRQSSLYGLLIHNADDLLQDNGSLLMNKMEQFKEKGLVEKIGISVYSGWQIDKILGRYEIDIVQLPTNVLDQRLLHGGQLSKLKASNVEIHARSAFLQGLLLMEPSKLNEHFDAVKPLLIRYHATIRKQGLLPVQAALGFVTGLHDIDYVVCGVNDHKQLEEICNYCAPLCHEIFEEFSMTDDTILNPSKWH